MKAVTALLQKPPADNCMSFVQVRQLDEANAGLERCLHRHADLYILAPKGCIILDAKGCIREINGKN